MTISLRKIPLYASFVSGHTVEYGFERRSERDLLVDKDVAEKMGGAFKIFVLPKPKDAERFAQGMSFHAPFHCSAEAGQLPCGMGAVLYEDKKAEPGIELYNHCGDLAQLDPEGFVCSWNMTTHEFENTLLTPYDRVRAKLDAADMDDVSVDIDGSYMDVWVDGYHDLTEDQMAELHEIAQSEPPAEYADYVDHLNWMIDRVEARAAEMREATPTALPSR